MHNYYWPFNVLGPKLLKKHEILEVILAFQLWQNAEYTTFEEGVQVFRKNIQDNEVKLNNLYSYLARLKNPVEADKIYSKFLKVFNKQKDSKLKTQQIYNSNLNLVEELFEQFPELSKDMLSYFTETEFFKEAKPSNKNLYISSEIILTKNRIESFKNQVEYLKQILNKKITMYNKLKKRMVI